MQHFDQPDVIFDAGRVLRSEEDGGAPRRAGKGDILCVKALKDQVRPTLEPAVPPFNIRHRLAEILVIDQCDVNGINTTRAQLAKDILGPVRIL